MGLMATRVTSLIWGCAEAMFFFLVPDIWLSRIVLRDWREASVNILLATLGALIGGCFLYYLSRAHFDLVRELLDYVPAISKLTIDRAGEQIGEVGLLQALFHGMITGVPYKLFASWSGHLQLSLGTFLVASAGMRMLRFAAVSAFVGLLGSISRDYLSLGQKYWLHGLCWALFYAYYFYQIGI